MTSGKLCFAWNLKWFNCCIFIWSLRYCSEAESLRYGGVVKSGNSVVPSTNIMWERLTDFCILTLKGGAVRCIKFLHWRCRTGTLFQPTIFFLKILFPLLFIYCLCVWVPCLHECAPWCVSACVNVCVCVPLEGQKRTLHSLYLELKMAVSCHVRAGTAARAMCARNCWASFPASAIVL